MAGSSRSTIIHPIGFPKFELGVLDFLGRLGKHVTVIRIWVPPLDSNICIYRGLRKKKLFFLLSAQGSPLTFASLTLLFLFWTNSVPIQLNPNTFRILFCVLTLNNQYGWCLILLDVLRCYKLVKNNESVDRYCFSPWESGLSMTLPRKTSKKGWNDRYLIVSDDRHYDHLQAFPISSVFIEIDICRFHWEPPLLL